MSESKQPRKRGRPRASEKDRLRHVVQLRLNNPQYSYVFLLADTWGCSAGEAIRRIIDAALDADPTVVEGAYVEGKPATLRQSLEFGSPTPEWVAEHVRRVGQDEPS